MTAKRLMIVATVLAMALLLGSCDAFWNLVGTASIVVSPTTATIAIGSTVYPVEQQITVTALSAAGSAETWTATSSDVAVATVDRALSATFYVNAKAAGVAKVTVTSASGKSAFVDVTVKSIPVAPTGLAAGTVTSNTVPLTWTAVTGATSYDVDVSSNAGTTWLTTPDSTTAVSYTVTGLTASTSYSFRVRAVNAAGAGAWCTAVAATTLAGSSGTTQLAAPTGLALTVGSETPDGVTLTWSAVTNAASYWVYYSTANAFAGASYVSFATTTGTLTALASSTAYYFWVTADASGYTESLPSIGIGPITTLAGGSTGVSADITTATTWSSNTNVTASISVTGTGTILTINPGVTVTFDAGVSLTIGNLSMLTAVGTAGSPIVFKSTLLPDYANGDYANAWTNINIWAGGVATIKYATIQDTGSSYWAVTCTGTLDLQDSTIENNFSGGIDVAGAEAAIIQNNVFGTNNWWDPTNTGLYDIDIGGNTLAAETGNTVTSGRYALSVNP